VGETHCHLFSPADVVSCRYRDRKRWRTELNLGGTDTDAQVCVNGKIELFRGVPEIIAKELSQITEQK
jgi:hypothetical protein